MIAIISDIHSNYEALKSVLRDIDNQNIKKIICLGDLVGYHSEPEKCLSILRKRNIECLLGNHDSYLTDNSYCSRSKTINEIIVRQRKQISTKNLNWVKSLKTFKLENKTLFTHGGPANYIDQYVTEINSSLFENEYNFLIVGHTHVQFKYKTNDNKLFLNPGSVGQPRDGDPRAAYAIFDGTSITLKRVTYNISATIKKMEDLDYPKFIFKNLNKGLDPKGCKNEISIRL